MIADGADRFTVEQYQQMIAAGSFPPDQRIELHEGALVRKMPGSPRHEYSVWKLSEHLFRCLPESFIYRIKSPIVTADSQTAPDIAIVAASEDDYCRKHPGARDTALVVEVSDESLDLDQGIKHRIYARAHIPIYWIVNIPDAQIEVYTQPRAGKSPTYRQQRSYRLDESVPLVLAGQEIAPFAVRDLLPPPPPA